jgi:hypothetical protein
MPRLIKGSKEAHDFMLNLRLKRKAKGGAITMPDIPSDSSSSSDVPSPVEEKVVGSGMKSSKNSWINHVKNYAKTHGMSYFTALKQPNIKEGYKK